MATQSAPLPPPPAENAPTQSIPPAPPSKPASTTNLATAFGGLSTKPTTTPTPTIAQPGPSTGPAPPTTLAQGPLSKPIINTRSAQDEMAAWMAPEFTIGMIPETEPPLEVR